MSHYKSSLFLFWPAFILAVLSGNKLFIASVVLIFLIVLSIGSYRIQSNFYLPSISKADTDKKNIVLSFDDGPSSAITPLILDILKDFNCQAIFFCIGKNISGNEHILKRMVAEGHIVANHSFSHSYWFDFFPARKVQDELKKTNEEIFRATGLRSKLFRPPYGVTNPMIASAIKNLGISSIGWNKRSLDTVIKNNNKVVGRISKNTAPGDIILLHDSVARCPEVLKEFLVSLYGKTEYKVERLDKVIEIECYEN
jgi:peptidoglycan/xylan/chitin deacetylase (PgdA/CDA1 family)